MIENFINNITSGNKKSADASFSNLIMTKVNTVLDIKRIELTSDIFNKQENIKEAREEGSPFRVEFMYYDKDGRKHYGKYESYADEDSYAEMEFEREFKKNYPKLKANNVKFNMKPSNWKHNKGFTMDESLTESADDAYNSALEQEMTNPRFVTSQQIINANLTPQQSQCLEELIMDWHISGGNLQTLLRGFYQKVYVSGNNPANPVVQKALAFVLDKL